MCTETSPSSDSIFVDDAEGTIFFMIEILIPSYKKTSRKSGYSTKILNDHIHRERKRMECLQPIMVGMTSILTESWNDFEFGHAGRDSRAGRCQLREEGKLFDSINPSKQRNRFR